MNLDAARKQMAELMVLRHDIHLDAATRLTPQPGNESPAYELTAAASEKLAELDRSIVRFSERCAANPELWPEMQQWMIDISGKSEAAPLDQKGAIEEQLGALMSSGAEFAAKHGSLMYTVRHAIEALDLRITDCGGGLGAWDLGVPCDEADAQRLCSLLHLRFHSAISVGLMTVRRRYWGWRFKAIYNASDAIEYLRKCS